MRNHPTNTPNGPWRLLILDRTDPADPMWLVCTVEPSGVRPAGGETYPSDVTRAWVASRTGHARAGLTAKRHADVWQIGVPDGPGIYT